MRRRAADGRLRALRAGLASAGSVVPRRALLGASRRLRRGPARFVTRRAAGLRRSRQYAVLQPQGRRVREPHRRDRRRRAEGAGALLLAPQGPGFVRNTLGLRLCDLIIGYAAGTELVQHSNPYYRSVFIAARAARGPLDGISSSPIRVSRASASASPQRRRRPTISTDHGLIDQRRHLLPAGRPALRIPGR